MIEPAVKTNFELPSTWTVTRIGDVAVLSPKSDFESVRLDETVHFIPMAAVSENFGGIDTSHLRPFGEVRKGYTSFSEGDVLFAKITPCMENGKGGLVPHLRHRHGFGSTEFHVLKPTQAVLPTWLEHYLSQPDFRKVARHNMTGTAGQMRVPGSWLGTAGIPVAPVAEQTRIVEKLEELLSDLDAGVTELKAAQKKLGQYRQSLLKAAVEGALTAEWRAARKVGAGDTAPETGAQLLERILTERRARWEAKQLARFAEQGKSAPKDWQKKYPEPVQPDTSNVSELPEGWVWASLGQLLAELTSGSRDWAPYYDRGKSVFVMAQNVRPWRPDFTFKQYVDPPVDHRDRLRSEIRLDDLLTTIVGANTGQVCRVSKAVSSHFVCQSVSLMRLVMSSMSEFVNAVLNSEGHGQRQFREMNYGAGRPHLSFDQLEAVLVPLPPLDEQVQVVNVVADILRTCEQTEAELVALFKQSAAQRKNILKAAFSGQLVPQDPNDEPASVLLARIRTERALRAAVKEPHGRKTKETA